MQLSFDRERRVAEDGRPCEGLKNDFDYYPFGPEQFTNLPGEMNEIELNDLPYPIQNRAVHHNFKPLTDLLNHPSWTVYDFFSGEYKVRRWVDVNDLEAYYLQDGAESELSTVAIGWVRNRNSSIFNSYYLASTVQQFFSCDPPDPATSDAVYLNDFVPGTYHISWFPTRMNSTVHPPDAEVSTVLNSTLLRLDLEGQFGGIANDYLDTLRGDYAFVITPAPFVKSLQLEPVEPDHTDWDFTVYPNPAHEGFTLWFRGAGPKEVAILDLSGRLMIRRAGVAATTIQFTELGLAQGAYWVRVSDGFRQRTKKLIMH